MWIVCSNANSLSRTLALSTLESPDESSCHPPSSTPTVAESEGKAAIAIEMAKDDVAVALSQPRPPFSRAQRRMPPFIASHDLPRGALYAFQALLSYVLMLSVMWVGPEFRDVRCGGVLKRTFSPGPSKQRISSR